MASGPPLAGVGGSEGKLGIRLCGRPQVALGSGHQGVGASGLTGWVFGGGTGCSVAHFC